MRCRGCAASTALELSRSRRSSTGSSASPNGCSRPDGWPGFDSIPYVVGLRPATLEPPRTARLGPWRHELRSACRIVGRRFALGDDVEVCASALLVEPRPNRADVVGLRLGEALPVW